MDLGISGKKALVLSAGGGLGRAIALELAREGAILCLVDRNEKSLEETAQLISTTGAFCKKFIWDLSKPKQWEKGIADIVNQHGGVDILINNSGGPKPGPAFGHELTEWREAYESMVLPIIGITDLLLPGMRERRWGRIITSTSSGVIAPIANLALSNTTRTALLGWSKTLARDIAKDGVTANIVVPGRIATRRTQFLDTSRAQREGKDVATIEQESAATIPLGRYGKPEEYADVITFLASERASYITGSIIRVDGGLISSL